MNPSTPPSQPAPRTVAGYVLVLTLLAFALRLYRLGSVEFWFDEAASYVVAVRDFGDIIAYVRSAISEHPPFYFFLLHTWMRAAGQGEFAMRFLSLWLGVLFVPLAFRFGRREFGVSTGLTAGLLAAASPFLFVYSQEARMYTLLPLVSLLTLEATLGAVRRDRARDWLALFMLLALGIGSHYYYGLWIPALGVFLAARWRTLPRRTLVRFIALMATFAVLLAVWIATAPGPTANFRQLLIGIRIAPINESLERILQDMAWGETFGALPSMGLRLIALLTWLPALGAVWLLARKPRARESEPILACLALIVSGFAWVGVTPQGVVGRHVAALFPGFLLLLAVGVANAARSGGARGAWVSVGVMLSFALGISGQLQVDKGDWGQAFEDLDRAALPGDAVILAQPANWPLVEYYHKRPDVTVYFAPDQSQGGRVAPEDYAPAIARFIEETATRHARVWLGPTGALTSDPQQIMPKWLAAHRYAEVADYHRSVSFNLFVAGTSKLSAPVPPTPFGSHIRLLGATLGAEQVRTGDALPILLRWQTDAPVSADHLLVFRLIDDLGTTWAENRILPCGGYCQTSDWRAADEVEDRQAFPVPAGTPPGKYRLMLEVVDLAARAAMAIEPGRTTLTVARLGVVSNPALAAPSVENPVSARFGPALRLLGFSEAAREVREGGIWTTELLWRAESSPGEDLVAVFRWLNREDQPLAASEFPLGKPDYPSAAWRAGDLIRQRVEVPLPLGVVQDLRIALQVRGRDSGKVLPLQTAERAATRTAYPAPEDAWVRSEAPHLVLTPVRVRPLERSFVAPDFAAPLTAVQFGDHFQLAGYSLARVASQTVDVALTWRSLAAASTNFKVFVHVIADDDRVVAQHDGEPAYGFRPTRSWLRGEYVKDEHRVRLSGVPPGTYRLEVGLYDPLNGARVPVFAQAQPQAADRIILTTIHVP